MHRTRPLILMVSVAMIALVALVALAVRGGGGSQAALAVVPPTPTQTLKPTRTPASTRTPITNLTPTLTPVPTPTSWSKLSTCLTFLRVGNLGRGHWDRLRVKNELAVTNSIWAQANINWTWNQSFYDVPDPKPPPPATRGADGDIHHTNVEPLPGSERDMLNNENGKQGCFRVFLIGDFVDAAGEKKPGGPLLGVTRTSGGVGQNIILAQNKQKGNTLAHELGHALCLPGTTGLKDLMLDGSIIEPPGTYLSQQEIGKARACMPLLQAKNPTPTPMPTPPSPDTAAAWEFIIPGVPSSKLDAKLAIESQAPAKLTLANNVDGRFPKSGELLLGKTELVVYDTNTAACGALAVNQVCVTQRAKVGQKKWHPAGTQVKLATQLTAGLPGTGVAHTTLETTVSDTQSMPFAIAVADAANFSAAGYITISHQGTQSPNLIGLASEYFQYDNNSAGCPALGPNQLCLIDRALQPNNEAYQHPASGFAQPGGTPGVSTVDTHVQITVKSNAGFFPQAASLIYDIGPGNTIENAELFSYDNAAFIIKQPGPTEFHITARAASPSTFKKTAIVQHAAGSVVTGADTYVVCRVGFAEPGVVPEPVTQNPVGSSVAAYLVCYTQSQPNGPPKTLVPKVLLVPLVGQPLILHNALAQPYLSTGGFDHFLYGAVPHVDTNGTTDGVLNLISPCILDFTPGTNLQVNLTVTGAQNLGVVGGVAGGDITVVLDTTGDNCDDPAGTGPIIMTTYDTTNSVDTDGDGCTDLKELDRDQTKGGLRDPWNPHDFFDVGSPAGIGVKDGIVDLFNDIVQTITAFGAYNVNADRGAIGYGPFDWNRSGPDGVVDLFNDIVGVIMQFGHDCRK